MKPQKHHRVLLRYSLYEFPGCSRGSAKTGAHNTGTTIHSQAPYSFVIDSRGKLVERVYRGWG